MATQAELDEMIAKVKAALYAINPAYALDYVPEDKKPLRNSAVIFNQVDLTGEQPVIDSTDCCPVCKGVMPFSFGVGRPASYCSNACKMKSYRQRAKPLRNEQIDENPLQDLSGRFIGVSGTVHKFPINPLKVIKAPALLQSFDDLQSFFGGSRS